jgi:hypothetical protein
LPSLIAVNNDGEDWHNHGKLHRLDGPAYNDGSGNKWWYIDGIRYNNNLSFQEAANLTAEEMCVLVLKYGNIK